MKGSISRTQTRHQGSKCLSHCSRATAAGSSRSFWILCILLGSFWIVWILPWTFLDRLDPSLDLSVPFAQDIPCGTISFLCLLFVSRGVGSFILQCVQYPPKIHHE